MFFICDGSHITWKTQKKLHLQLNREAFQLKYSVEVDDMQLLCNAQRNL